jgi:hypothetical protein
MLLLCVGDRALTVKHFCTTICGEYPQARAKELNWQRWCNGVKFYSTPVPERHSAIPKNFNSTMSSKKTCAALSQCCRHFAELLSHSYSNSYKMAFSIYGMRFTVVALALRVLFFGASVVGFTAVAPAITARARLNNLQSFSLASTVNQSETWQADLEELLNPLTPPGRRQILFSELLNANEKIRASVQKALKERDVSGVDMK